MTRKAITVALLILALCQVPQVASSATRTVESPLPSFGGAEVFIWSERWTAPKGIHWEDTAAQTEDLIMHLNGVKVPWEDGVPKGTKLLRLWVSTDRRTMLALGGGSRRDGFSGLYSELPITVTIEAKVETLTRDWDPRRQRRPSTKADRRTHTGSGTSTLVAFGGRISVGSYRGRPFEPGGAVAESAVTTWKEAYGRALDRLWDNPKIRVSSKGPFTVNSVDGNTVILEAGSDNEVKPGQTFAVYRGDLEVRSATTGEILSQKVARGAIPVVKVVSVEPGLANCEVISGNPDSIRPGDRADRCKPPSNEAPPL